MLWGSMTIINTREFSFLGDTSSFLAIYLCCLHCVMNAKEPSSIDSYQDYFKVLSGNDARE